jgi:X box-binding protein 1
MSKYLAVAPRPAYVVTDLSDEDDSDIDVEVDDLADKKPARKRQRLDHLSPEEKLQRRKLKNRVAAQTARDRKKARMDDLEAAVKRSEREINKLKAENELLWKLNANLKAENEALKTESEKKRETVQVAELSEKPFGPAAIISAPQQREQGSRSQPATRNVLVSLLPLLLSMLATSSARPLPSQSQSVKGGNSSTKSLPSLLPYSHPTKWPPQRQERLATAVMKMIARRKPPPPLLKNS